ncbi:MAG TPA: protein kinase [Ktedonobacteraceae bacterium]|nr:protein kinase [Ktedonobacteraceae bacterium]
MLLNNRYELSDQAGRDATSTVYRGIDTYTGKSVAIKVLRPIYSTDAKRTIPFHNSAKLSIALQHPNIVQVLDYGQDDENYYIVREFVEGIDLRHYFRSRGGILDINRVIIIAGSVASALGYAHDREIVHGDLKPQNILVVRGMHPPVKVADFGMSSIGVTLGAIQYRSPEQLQAETVSPGPATDVYSLGILMYEMMVGYTPFDGDTPVSVAIQHMHEIPIPPTIFNPNIPQSLEGIVMKCLEKEPEKRLKNGVELTRALEGII